MKTAPTASGHGSYERLLSVVTEAWGLLERGLSQATVIPNGAGASVEAVRRDFLDAMNTHNTPSWQVRAILDGVRVPPHHYATSRQLKVAHVDIVDRAALNRYFERGATVVLDDAQTAMPRMSDLCSSLSDQFEVPTACTIFTSPPHADGFALHQDAEDVVIVQLAGAKRWVVFPPLQRQSSSMLNRSECDEPVFDTELNAGDVLVLPKGSPHKTASNSRNGSMHMTLGFYPISIRDALVRVIAHASDERLDDSLPTAPGELLDVFRGLEAEVRALVNRPPAVMDPLRTRFIGDTAEFRLTSSELPAEGGTYRVQSRITAATYAFLAAHLGRPDDAELKEFVSSLSDLKAGDVFSLQGRTGVGDNPILVQEALHAMLRMRFVAHA